MFQVSTTLSAMKKKQGTEIELEFLVAPKLSEVQQYGRDLADRCNSCNRNGSLMLA
jgi:hypothetical protein